VSVSMRTFPKPILSVKKTLESPPMMNPWRINVSDSEMRKSLISTYDTGTDEEERYNNEVDLD
jgi:hypothetical protein